MPTHGHEHHRHHHHHPGGGHPPATAALSILRLSAAVRLLAAGLVITLIWVAIYWAIAWGGA